MPAAVRRAALAPPPSDFDRLIEWLEDASNGLVLLEEYPLGDLQAMVRRVGEVVEIHGQEFDERLGPEPVASGGSGTWALLRADHNWFSISTAQFGWFLGIVEHEDHGGHRQALGQYGRLLAEALRRHRTLEAAYLERRR